MIYHDKPTAHLPALAIGKQDVDWSAIKTRNHIGRDKSAHKGGVILDRLAVCRLVRVTLNNSSEMSTQRKREIIIQHWTGPLLQEPLIDPDPPPGLGRAVTKAAMKATAKKASLENMVKMKEVSEWKGLWFWFSLQGKKTKLVNRLKNFNNHGEPL
jgi:hypothetical protein